MTGRKHEHEQSDNTNRYKAIIAISLIIIAGLTYPMWSEWIPNTQIDPDQGLQLTGTVNYANKSAVTGETVMFVDKATRTTSYTAAITSGSFTTNIGPKEGGIFTQYISLGGCMLYVQDVTVPIADEYDHSAYTVESAVVYTNAASNGWSALVTGGSVANSFTGGGSAATANYTASAGSAVSFDIKITLATNYAKLFKQYSDPFDESTDADTLGQDVQIRPVLWIEIGSATGVYATTASNAKDSFTAGSVTYLLMELSQLTSSTTVDVNAHFDISIVASSAATLTFKIYLLDGSDIGYLETAKAKVANPDSGETIASHNLVNAYLIVS